MGLGIAQCLFAWIQYGGFGAAGQSLTRKLREASFTALLAQEVAYFDEEVRQYTCPAPPNRGGADYYDGRRQTWTPTCIV